MREFLILLFLTAILGSGIYLVYYFDSGNVEQEESVEDEMIRLSDEMEQWSAVPGMSNYEYFNRKHKY